MALEFRAYYDEQGKVITYTTQNLEGNYIIVSALDYHQCRHDAIVIDGQLIHVHQTRHVTKLAKNPNAGTKCSKYDISVISDDDEYEFFTVRAYAIK